MIKGKKRYKNKQTKAGVQEEIRRYVGQITDQVRKYRRIEESCGKWDIEH